MDYEIDSDHVINMEINGVNLTISYTKNKNEKIKDLILDILMNNYENRMQEYIEKGLQKAENVV